MLPFISNTYFSMFSTLILFIIFLLSPLCVRGANTLSILRVANIPLQSLAYLFMNSVNKMLLKMKAVPMQHTNLSEFAGDLYIGCVLLHPALLILIILVMVLSMFIYDDTKVT